MIITFNWMLLVLAFGCMVLAAFDARVPRVNLAYLALALWLLTLIIPR